MSPTAKPRARTIKVNPWPGIVAGALALGIGVGFTVAKVSPDPFQQWMIISGLALVAGGNVTMMALARRWLGAVAKAAITPEEEAK